MVICLERGADLHMVQLMPLPLTVSCFSRIQISFTFLVPAHPGSPGKRAVKRVCRRELSRRRLLPAVSPAAGHLTTPTAAWLPGLCENFRPTTSESSSILRLLSSHWATSVVRTRVVGVANVGDSLRRLSSLRHRIYNLLDTHTHTLAWTAPSLRRIASCHR